MRKLLGRGTLGRLRREGQADHEAAPRTRPGRGRASRHGRGRSIARWRGRGPVPPVSRARAASRRTKGSKIRSASAGAMPMPVSWTAKIAWPSAVRSESIDRAARGRVLHRVLDEIAHGAAEGAARRRARPPASPGPSFTFTPVPWASRVPTSSASSTRGSSSTGGPRHLRPRRRARQEQEILGHADEPVDVLEARGAAPAGTPPACGTPAAPPRSRPSAR